MRAGAPSTSTSARHVAPMVRERSRRVASTVPPRHSVAYHDFSALREWRIRAGVLAPLLENTQVSAVGAHVVERLLHGSLKSGVVFAHHDALRAGGNRDRADLQLVFVLRDIVARHR